MQTSLRGVEAIKQHEALRLSSYQDPGGVWTIGYGHTQGVKPGDRISTLEATEYLISDLAHAENAINDFVKVPLRQSQFDALVSFAFNCGAEAFQRSTLLRKLNAGDYDGAANEFKRWNKDNGVVLVGLTRRREIESDMFREPAPIINHDVAYTPEEPVAPFIAAALPTIIGAVPDLIKIFSDKTKPISERNVAAAEKVVDIAIKATGTQNAQEAAEKILSDPAAADSVREAIQARWFEIVESGGGVPAAREFLKSSPDFVPIMRAVTYSALGFLLIANLIVVGMVVGAALGKPMEGWQQLLGIVIQADVGSATIALGFWLGSSLAKPRLDSKI